MRTTPTIYVSHSSQDDPYALRFVQDLLACGAAVWTTETSAGAAVATRASDLIHACAWFVVVHTPDAVASATVQAEIAVARAAQREQGQPTLVAFVATGDQSSIPRDMRRLAAAGPAYARALEQLVGWMGLAPVAALARGAATTPAIPGYAPSQAPWLPADDVTPVAYGVGYPLHPKGAFTVAPRGASLGVSRRDILLGAGALLGVAAFGTGGLLLARTLATRTTISRPPTPLSGPTFLPQGRLLLTYSGHTNPVNMVAWSPNGRQIASASADATAQVWAAATGSRATTYANHTASVSSVAWSHHGDRIATSSNDGTVQIWHPATGSRILTYTGHTGNLSAARWSPDDTRIASAGDDGVQIWDAHTGTRHIAYTFHTHLSDAAWSPDGARVAISSFDKTVTIIDAATGMPQFAYSGHTDPIFAIAWSPDGRMLASAGANTGVHVWDAATGSDITNFAGNANGVNALAWSRDSRYIASGGGNGQGIGDTRMLIWNEATKQIGCIYTGHPRYVNSAAWSPDNLRMATGSDDHTVQVWQVEQSA